jgi:hypothetical protein
MNKGIHRAKMHQDTNITSVYLQLDELKQWENS